jgi:hypothetical protein
MVSKWWTGVAAEFTARTSIENLRHRRLQRFLSQFSAN